MYLVELIMFSALTKLYTAHTHTTSDSKGTTRLLNVVWLKNQSLQKYASWIQNQIRNVSFNDCESLCVIFGCFLPCMFQKENAIIQVIGLWEECFRQEWVFDQKSPRDSKGGGEKQCPWYFHFPSGGTCFYYCNFWSPISWLIIVVISE